jgi:signal transduction histidine kinase
MKILVVDDDDIALAVASKILGNNGYEVETAEDGETALEIQRAHNIQIVISDWNMPKMTGIDLCRSLRSSPKVVGYIYIVIVTARNSKEDMIQGLSAGADDFLSKPFEPAELLVRVRNAERILAMEIDLKHSETRNLALLSAVPDTIYRIRRDGILLDYKANSSDLMLLPEEEIIGAPLSSILPDLLMQDAMVCIQNALQSKEIQTMEYTQKIGASSYVFEARFKDSGADEVTAIIRDISDQARLEQMKSDFINRASHELRTPIANMVLMAHLIDSGGTQEEKQEYWDVLKNELARERTLVEDLLSVGRMESGQIDLRLSSFDLAEMLGKVVQQMDLQARKKQISILLQIIPALDQIPFQITADEKALIQVFVNLLGNAIKYTPSDGSVNITLQRVHAGFEISISDTGIGIPSQDIPLLFTRFFRGTNAIEEEIPGTGIGLFIVHATLKKHGGKIKVSSELAKGSQFDIWLPEIAA